MKLTKSSIALLFVLLSTNSYAAINANPGLYFGGALSVANSTTPSGSSFSGYLDTVAHMSLSPTVGYRFNDYLAVEGGFLYAANNSNSGQNYSVDNTRPWGPDELKIYSFDAVVKGIVPFESGFSLFAKGGLAYTHQYVFNQVFANITDPEFVTKKTSNHFQPVVGAGVSYNFTKNFATELSYNYYVPTSNIGKISAIELGLTYTFGGDA